METSAELDQQTFQTQGVAIVSSAHAVHDTYTGFLAPLLPVLIQRFTLTNTAAGFLSLMLQLPSVFQPLIGHLADKRNLRLLLILAPALTGAAMSLLSVAPGYAFLVFLLLIAGLSSASLHAIGPVLGSTLSGSKLGRGMSFWMVGGELGRGLGPLLVVSAVGFLTLDGLPWLMLGGIFVSVFYYFKLPQVNTTQPAPEAAFRWKSAVWAMRRVMAPVAGVIITRSLMIAALTTFLPTFLTGEGSTLWLAGAALSITQLSGVIGAFLAGSLSDTFGRRRLLAISYTATPICMMLFLLVRGFWQLPFLILTGFFGISVIPVIMAVVLESFPASRSLANGVYMAVNFILSALGVVLAGKFADVFGMRTLFWIAAGLVPLGLPFILLLPKSRSVRSASEMP